MANELPPEPPKQGELFTSPGRVKPAPSAQAEPRPRSQRSPKLASPPKSAPSPKPNLDPAAEPKRDAHWQRLADLTLPDPKSMSDLQLTEELAWLKARTRAVSYQLRSKVAAAASAAKRSADQLTGEAVLQAIERHGGGYGSKGLAARELKISKRTLHRHLAKARSATACVSLPRPSKKEQL